MTGAVRLRTVMPSVFMAMAFISWSRLTISGIIAWRAGIIIPMIEPWITEAIIKIHHEVGFSLLRAPVERAKPMARETTAKQPIPAIKILFFRSLSAKAPPNTETIIIGPALTKDMVPRSAGEFVG